MNIKEMGIRYDKAVSEFINALESDMVLFIIKNKISLKPKNNNILTKKKFNQFEPPISQGIIK